MSKNAPYAPKHKTPQENPVTEVPKKAARTTLVLSALAIGGTAAAVAGGVVLSHPTSNDQQVTTTAAEAPTSVPSADAKAVADRERTGTTSRSSTNRPSLADAKKRAALGSVTSNGANAVTHSEDIADSDPHAIASSMLSDYGWDSSQMSCLDSLWTKESGWSVSAENPSGAYGIPQSLPGSKMASAGPDWESNPVTQIKWGLGYIQDRYGSPCSAWSHSEASNWY